MLISFHFHLERPFWGASTLIRWFQILNGTAFDNTATHVLVMLLIDYSICE